MEQILVEKYSSFGQVHERIVEICQAHRAEQLEAPHEDGESNTTVVLQNRWGGWLQVGDSEYGWLLILQDPDRPLYIPHGNSQIEGYIVFLLFSEWTELELSCLISGEIAKQIIKDWLDTGKVNQDILNDNS